MRANAALVLLCCATFFGVQRQGAQIALWETLHRRTTALKEQIATSSQSDLCHELSAFFADSGQWQSAAPLSTTSGQMAMGRAQVPYARAFEALALAARFGPGCGVWHLQTWRIQGLKQPLDRCDLEMAIAKGEGL